MDIKSTLVIGGLAFAGCLIGSYSALRVTPAHAQVVTPPPPTVQEQLFIPRDGLQMQTEDGRVIGVIGHRMGNGFLVLFDSQGRVGIELSAGSGGSAVIAPVEGGMGMQLSSTAADSQALLQVTGTQAQIELGGSGTSATLTSGSDSANLRMSHSGDRLATLIGATREGGRVTTYDAGGNAAIDLSRDRGSARLIVNAESGLPGISLLGSGEIAVSKDGEKVWGAPPRESDSDR